VTEFENLFRQATGPQHKVHEVLRSFSQHGNEQLNDGASGSFHLAEVASISVLLQCANDINKPRRKKLSNISRNAQDVLARDTITIAAVGMSRHDIASIEDVDRQRDTKFPLKMVTQNDLCYSVVNSEADDDCAYDDDNWKQTRLEKIEKCLGYGADIISLGEFDFPPKENTANDEEFESNIQTKIDAVDRPVFLVSGSRHEYEESEGHASCYNSARIFRNKKVDTVPRADGALAPIVHHKLVSAEKAGERITTPKDVQIQYYETNIGRIAVLICIDAYSPSVIFSLINNRNNGSEHKVEYIIVPSYNYSPKLFYSCQVLSLLCKCIVLLVDSCKECSSQNFEKPAEVALFIHGRLFSELLADQNGDELKVGKMLSDGTEDNVRAWELSIDYLNQLKQDELKSTPFLDFVDNFRLPESP